MAVMNKPTSLSKVWASSGDRAAPLDSKISQGWQIEIPPRQWFNWLDNRQDQAIAHINQHGIAVWDAETEYQAGKSYVQDPGNGVIYRCLVTHTGRQPSSSPMQWATAFLDASSTSLTPSGMIIAFAGDSAPEGYLKANGATISRTTYAKLFEAIGTSFGAGDGSTTFRLPDLRGEFIRGWDDGRGIDAGRTFGSSQSGQNEAHSHSGSTGSSGSHSHSISGTASSAGSHTHRLTLLGDRSSGDMGNRVYGDEPYYGSDTVTTHSAGAHTHSISGSATSAGSHSHSLTIGNSGGTESRPRNIALLYCIKY